MPRPVDTPDRENHHMQEVPLGAEDVKEPLVTRNASASTPSIEHFTNLVQSHPYFMHVLQIANIMAWYWTNGMNGIAMQSYAGLVNDPSHQTSAILRFLITLSITCLVTSAQLLLGSLIGRGLLWLLNSKITLEHIRSTHWMPLSMLHAVGSMATNLGFMYGKASLVQVLKLLEPFETLLLSQLLFQEGNCSLGIFSAMMIVVGAAMSLLKLQSTPPVPQAVVFAILSGLTLSTRNVLQRKHHHHHHNAQEEQSKTMTFTKLEKSVIQFTQLSFFSGVEVGAVSIVVYMIVQPYIVTPSLQVLGWHPLYNIFSMITLGFCSALTHSLLNAGKRVFAICMALLWFGEGLNPATLAGLAFVGAGGSWYSWECKRPSSSTTSPHREWYKLAVSLGALAALLFFQQQSSSP